MALWGNNDNVSALGESGAGVVTLDYDTLTITQTVIFCNSQQKVDWLATKIRKENRF